MWDGGENICSRFLYGEYAKVQINHNQFFTLVIIYNNIIAV